MALVDTKRTPAVRPTRLGWTLPSLLVLLGLLTGTTVHAALPFFAPQSNDIAALTVNAEKQQVYLVNGAFDGDGLTYSAGLTGGGSLPSWISLDATAGSLTIKAPSSARGNVLNIRVTATDHSGGKATESFYLVVDDSSLGCTIDANTDGLARLLSCDDGKTKLRGYTSTDGYKWSGPNGFSSSNEEPTVSTPGLYVLTTSNCGRKQAVEVLANAGSCKTVDDNNIPVARIDADEFSGLAPFTVNFDALLSQDSDGEIIDYRWTWGDVTAAGPTPTATFEAGSHKVMLTVTDNTGAKSTDYVTIEVGSADRVSYSTYWLEAECATVGSKWYTSTASGASGGSYVVAKSTSTGSAPSDVPDNRIRFTLDNARRGSYHLFARINSSDNQSDSYWVRVNGKEWVSWTNGIRTGQGFQWNEMENFQPYLNDGTNTIDIAFREPNARLDKIHLNGTGTLPSGTGSEASNCYEAANEAPIAVATAFPLSGEAPLAVTFDGSNSEDSDGNITKYSWKWSGGSGTGVKGGATLSAGTYKVTLTVTDDDGATHSSFVTVDVTDPAVADNEAIWLEAECAAVGSGWVTKKSSSASGGSYVTFPDRDAYSSPPSDVASNRVRFTVNSAKTAYYKLFARINAPSNIHDSYYIRVNGGSWTAWINGIATGEGFTWNQARNEIKLNAGTNTIDIAYRERNTMLDKLYLTTTSGRPSGMGGSAANCGTQSPPVADDQPTGDWMEAECASLGSGWVVRSSSGASNGKYAVFTGNNSLSSPYIHSSSLIRFRAYAERSGNYSIYFRMHAPDAGSDSFWVQVDGGRWIKFWSEEDGTNLVTNGWEWQKVNIDGNDFSINLSAGYHDIVIANREAGTKLDKVVLTESNTAPTGFGMAGGNCSSSQAMNMGGSATLDTDTDTEMVEAEGISLYPNPVVDVFNLTVSDAYRGDLNVTVIDVNGRILKTATYDKADDQLKVDMNVGTLPSGVYRLRLIEGDAQKVQSFIKQ